MAGGFVLKYGPYVHDVGEVALQISKSFSYDEKLEKSLQTETWTLDALLKGTSVANMKTEIEDLVAAYSINNQDLILFQGDGSTPTAHALLSANARGGTRVQSIEFPESNGPEHVTYRTYRIVVQADFEIVGRSGLLFFHEIVSRSGGAPRHVWQESLTGTPIKQTVNQQTTFKATQSGSAIGNLFYPPVPAPLFPDDLNDNPVITREGPKEVNTGVFREFKTSWEYQYTDEVLLSPTPNTPAR